AELVLGEQGVRLALRVLECASTLPFQRLDALEERRPLAHRPPNAHSSRTHDAAPGSRWPTDRSPRRIARPRRATSARVARIPRAPAWTAAAHAASGSSPRSMAISKAVAAGPIASRIVLSP